MKTYQCSKSYHSLEEMVKDPNLDAIGIFTPAPDHVRHVKLAMEHGKHVISAVPAACGTMEEAYALLDIVETTGLTYMMAETSYYQQFVISARKFYEEGKFGNLYHCESFYQHDGLEPLFFNPDGSKTWRHGLPPMYYPTHCTAHLVGVTGERMTAMETKQIFLILIAVVAILIVIPLIPKAIREFKGPDPEADTKNLARIQIGISEFVKVRGQYPESLDVLAPMYMEFVPKTADGRAFLYNPTTATASIPAAIQQNTGWGAMGGGSGLTPMGDAMTGMSVADEMNY